VRFACPLSPKTAVRDRELSTKNLTLDRNYGDFHSGIT
jgi:hypothetical protein